MAELARTRDEATGEQRLARSGATVAFPGNADVQGNLQNTSTNVVNIPDGDKLRVNNETPANVAIEVYDVNNPGNAIQITGQGVIFGSTGGEIRKVSTDLDADSADSNAVPTAGTVKNAIDALDNGNNETGYTGSGTAVPEIGGLVTFADESGLTARKAGTDDPINIGAAVWRPNNTADGTVRPLSKGGKVQGVLVSDNQAINVWDLLIQGSDGRVTKDGGQNAPGSGEYRKVFGRALTATAGGTDQTIDAWIDQTAGSEEQQP